MDVSFLILFFLFIIAMVAGFVGLKYMERKLGLIKSSTQEEQEEGVVTRPPVLTRMDDIDYIVDWFIRRDPKIDNPVLLKMSIVDSLVEETKIEFDEFSSKKHKFNRYLGELVDFLPYVSQAEEVMEKYYKGEECPEKGGDDYPGKDGEDGKDGKDGEGMVEEGERLANIRSYIIAKIRVLGWIYHCIYKRWYNQRDSEFLDFQEYIVAEEDLEKIHKN